MRKDSFIVHSKENESPKSEKEGMTKMEGWGGGLESLLLLTWCIVCCRFRASLID